MTKLLPRRPVHAAFSKLSVLKGPINEETLHFFPQPIIKDPSKSEYLIILASQFNLFVLHYIFNSS
jgi:hypothetical protein